MGMVPNGLLPNVAAGVTRRRDGESWAVAEDRTAELIARIQPNSSSEGQRLAVFNYVQRLIMKCLSCQVVTFGSVPLKTYLPDGDIDVTAFSDNEELKDAWATVVRDALEHEEKSESAEFRVKEVQYIQAEVKIIKCLVENIVVDISFNQVGGLCTLCFLEEIDNLINQNHLFKRSIILIKAWCYYESRILGAHHGLISTYALETLVLYIFHVFNNCFAGPLEVLYRFLEFFSKFDWEKFCVSLWGPVPISSLPDMAAEPPQKDSGELLLSKSFLEKCSSFYAVTPLENQGQPFVSKHFNVIDPLRTNNNLGRSVSKGNFFRIRSAFAFGAKRLARLLECPKEDLVVEVNQFFTNTWRRHGSGNRPDAPTPSLVHQQPLKTVPVEVPNNHRSTKILKEKTENHIFCIDQDNLTEGGHSYHDPTSQLLNKISLHSQNSPRTVNPAVSHGQSQKIYGMQADNKSSEQLERNSNPGRPVQAEKYQRAPNTHFMNDMNGQSRSRFARTHSSPELTESSVDGFSRVRRATGVEMEKSPKVDYSSRGNNLILEISTNHIAVSSQDGPVSSMNSSSNPSVKTASDSNSVSSNYCEDIGFALNAEPASVSEALEMQHEKSQEEQVLVNLMASTRLHGFDGQVQLPMQIPSDLSAASSPLLASTAHLQRNLAALSPTNFSLIGAPWLSNVQFLQGFVPPPMTHYVHSPTFAQHTEDGNESEKSATSDVNCDDGDNWRDHGAGLSRNFGHERRDPQMFHFEGKEHHPSPDSVSGARLQGQPKFGPRLQGQPKFGTEDGVLGENHADVFHNQTNRRTSINSNMRSGNVRFASSQASASRNKTLPDSSWDASTGKTQRSSRDKWGKRPAFAATATAAHSKTKSSWQTENADHVRAERNDDIKNGDAIPLAKNDISDITVGSVSSSAQSQTSQVLDDYDPSEISIPNPVFAPFLIGSPQQRQVDNSGLTFVQTGPPVPFVMWFPRNTDGSAPQFERNEGTDQFPVNAAVQNFGLLDAHQPDANITSASSSIITDLSDEHKSDILNSDFVSHWQNLQYGRFCQGVRPLGPLLYPFALPPVYLQGHVPWDGPGRPPLPNVNWTQVMGPGQRVLPVMPLQPAPERASGVFQRYGEDAPRYRGGTGTYLPTPKVPFRNRQSSTRNYRGSLNSDRGDHSDREGSWINSKQRNVGRSYGHDQSERAVMRPDRQAAGESQSDRQCQSYRNDSYRHEAGAPYLIQSHSFESVNSTRRPGNMMYGVYSPPSTASSGDGALPGSSMPPAAVLYSCEQGVNYAASTEPLEFGSLRPVATTDSSDVPQPTHEGLTNGFYEQRHAPYRGGSCRSSPDQPSSPHLRR